jgi:hypothetical protein
LLDDLAGSDFIVLSSHNNKLALRCLNSADDPKHEQKPSREVTGVFSDAVILVGRYGQTTRRAITRGVGLIEDSRARLAGVVVNEMDLTSPDYRYFAYGYSWSGGRDRRYSYTKREESWASEPDDPVAGPTKSKGAHA